MKTGQRAAIKLAALVLFMGAHCSWANTRVEEFDASLREIRARAAAELVAGKKAAEERAKAAPPTYRLVVEGDRVFCRNAEGKVGLNAYIPAKFGLSPRDRECMDLKNLSFRRRKYDPASFAGSDFSGADMRWADFTMADMRGVNLQKVDLSLTMLAMAKLNDADLRGAIFTQTTEDLIKGINLKGATYDDKTVFPFGNPGAETDRRAAALGMVKVDKDGNPVAIVAAPAENEVGSVAEAEMNFMLSYLLAQRGISPEQWKGMSPEQRMEFVAQAKQMVDRRHARHP